MKFPAAEGSPGGSRRLRIRQGRLAMTDKSDPGGALDEREPDSLHLSERDYDDTASEKSGGDAGDLPLIPL